VPPRPHPLILIVLAAACFVVAFLIAPRRALPSDGHGAAHRSRPTAPTAAAPRAARMVAAAGAARRAPRVAPPVRAARRAPRVAPAVGAAPRATRVAPAVGAAPRATRVATAPALLVTWRWPLRGRIVGAFRLTPHAPFARGQRRGIDVAAPAGTPVHAACAGRVSFAGALPHEGLAVTVRCGPLVATYLRLGHLDVRRGTHAATGQRLGTLGASGRLRLGARRAGDRHGYVDPLALLRDPRPSAPPTLGPAPRPVRPRPTTPAPAPRPLPVARARPRNPLPLASTRPLHAPTPARGHPCHLPWPAYPALALMASALPIGGLVHRRRRRHATAAAAAAHEGP
jgi:murein DD-endopeptidase MepM/ murein hydrolase activator NlpD